MEQPAPLAPGKPLKILVVDDHLLIRQLVTGILDGDPRFEVIGEAENGLDALAQAERLKPDVVVLDISMPVLDGFEAARRMRKCHPPILIVILSTNESQDYIDEMKKIGAGAYVAKPKAADSLKKAIETVFNKGEFFVA